MASPSATRSRWWLGTHNNPSEGDLSACRSGELSPIGEGLTYFVGQLEVGEAGTPHIQFLVKYIQVQSLASALNKLRWTCHLEVVRDRARAQDYCQKEETRSEGPWEIGTSPAQGKRNDLADIQEHLRTGGGMHSVVEDHFGTFVRYGRGITQAQGIYAAKRGQTYRGRKMTSVYWGDAGTGKTRKAYEDDPELYCLQKDADTVWFDAYEGQKTLLLDDYYGWIKWGFFLNLLDGHPCRLPRKGSHTWAEWTRVIITSNQPVEEWYPNKWEDLRCRKALIDRIRDKTEFKALAN